jgi:hypothetical protein
MLCFLEVFGWPELPLGLPAGPVTKVIDPPAASYSGLYNLRRT